MTRARLRTYHAKGDAVARESYEGFAPSARPPSD
jgi:hypothetical protein